MSIDDREPFFTRLAEVLVPAGFRRADEESFRRSWPGGFDGIVPMTVRGGPLVKLDFSLDVRHDAVEELLAETDPSGMAQRSDGVTSITRMGDLREGSDFFYRLALPAELDTALADFAAYMATDGAAHFRALRDPLAMERAFNGAPDMPCVHCRNEVRRVLRGLVLAGLYRPMELEFLVDAYRRCYAADWDAQRLKPRFDALVAVLRRRMH